MKRAFARYGNPVPISDALQPTLLTDADASIIQMRAAAARGGEQLLADRIVDHAVLQAAALLTGDGDREHREAVQKVRRAIQRIDDPDGLVLSRAAAFLGQDGVIRVVACG